MIVAKFSSLTATQSRAVRITYRGCKGSRVPELEWGLEFESVTGFGLWDSWLYGVGLKV